MANVSLSEAARLAGVSRKTIQRHISIGKLTATMSQGHDAAMRQVETSELMRVYGQLVPPTVPPVPATCAPQCPTLSTPNVAPQDALNLVIEAQKETIDLLKRHVDELTTEKKELRAQVVGLLEYRKPAPAPTPAAPAKTQAKPDRTALWGLAVIVLAAAVALTMPLWWPPH